MAALKGSTAGLRAIAVFEATKGLLVIIAGTGLFRLAGGDVQGSIHELLSAFHLNPARHHPNIFLDALTHLNRANLRAIAASALIYAVLKLIEAYGLWRERMWAQWLAAASVSLFIPIEIYELSEHVTMARLVIFAANVTLAVFLLYRIIVQSYQAHIERMKGR
ncbi:MAG: DUF2127 domain-containing protein [Spirochaetota bacterium]